MHLQHVSPGQDRQTDRLCGTRGQGAVRKVAGGVTLGAERRGTGAHLSLWVSERQGQGGSCLQCACDMDYSTGFTPS